MALPVNTEIRIWSITLVVFMLVLWFLGDVLLPFAVGGAIAYFLDPVADRLEKLGLSRILATVFIAILVLATVVIVSILVIPAFIKQAIDLANLVPDLVQEVRAFVLKNFPQLTQEESSIKTALAAFGEKIQSRALDLVNTIFTSALSLINIFVLLIIIPVVAVYLLIDWDHMIADIDNLLPRDHAPTIRRLASQIDRTMAGFVRGMVTVCTILGTYYAIALMLIGLDFGLVVGFIAGMLTFIPYLGALIGGGLAIGLALFQFWGDWIMVFGVYAIFQAGQFVEGNFLTPKLVGGSVGLHPVWLLFALSFFGSIFGFIGLLVAVPAAAAIGVLARFAVERYLDGKLYKGQAAYEDEE